MRYSGAAWPALAAFMLSACGDARPVTPEFAPNRAPEASIVGDIGPGSSYEIIVPPIWNGDLILYAHGYVDPASTDPLTDLEEALLAVLPTLGYAVAWSSYSESGLAIKDGAQRTKQLRGIFVSEVGSPERTYLVGGSMGSLVALNLAERFPKHYDGVLGLCGMVGGSRAQIDYVGHVRVLFDALYPGALPGSLFANPSLSPAQVQAFVAAAVVANPAPAGVLGAVMAATFGTPIPASNGSELLASLVAALTFDIRGFADVLDRTHGHVPFANADVVYVGSADDAALNRDVARYEATPDALNHLQNYYAPSGALKIPVVTLHNVLDPVVPAFHEALLAASAAGAGHSGSLVQLWGSTTFGHCAFDVGEVLGGLGMLVALSN